MAMPSLQSSFVRQQQMLYFQENDNRTFANYYQRRFETNKLMNQDILLKKKP